MGVRLADDAPEETETMLQQIRDRLQLRSLRREK